MTNRLDELEAFKTDIDPRVFASSGMRRLNRFHVHHLWSPEGGTTYTGMTNDIRRHLREHYASGNTGYTRGRRWRLLAVRCYIDRDSALVVERQLIRSKYDKRNWIRRLGRAGQRLFVLRCRYG